MSDLLTELRRRDVTLWVDGDSLRFSAPTGALTPELRAEMGARKSELLETLVLENEAGDSIVPTDREAGSPLSFSQEPLWILDQIAPGLATYNIELCWRIKGPLDLEVLERSLNEIVKRHEILRTRIDRDAHGNLVQIAMPHTPRAIPVVVAGAGQLEHLVAEESERAFDLSRGPLWRALLARFSEQDHALLLAWHHLAFDGWSQTVFIRELATLYTAFREGRPSPLAELPIQFGDFAHWQRKAFKRGNMQAHLAYWRAQFAGDRPPIALPTDRPRPAQQSHRGAIRARDFAPGVAAQLRALARDQGVTLFMLLLAGFKTLLARYTGETDLCIGSPITQRSHVETEPLIGFFVNMLALRTDLAGDPTFREILQRVRATSLDAFEHQDVPFEKIVEELNPTRHLSHQPIFQVAFVLEPTGDVPPSLPGLTIEPVKVPGSTAKFDLTLTVAESADGLRAKLEYSTDLFDAATIDRLLISFELLLKHAADDPATHLSRLPILDPAERERLLVEWNPEPPAFASDETLPRLFAKAVARFPNAVAVTDEYRALTYAELDAESSRLAALLQSLGVRPETIVALYLDRTAELIVALLAVLKAGGAYLPLDLMYPAERLAFMLSDAQATVILTESHLVAALPAHSANLVCLDRLDLPDAQPAQNAAAADSLAYVIYTSGSTGQPKGCCLTHRHVARLFSATDAWFSFDERDVWTMFHSPAFDFSVWEIWGALLHGGRLVVVPFLTSRSPEAFRKLLADEHVTVLNQTPSAFRQLIHADEIAIDELALRLVIFGGEALEMASLKPWFDRHGDSQPQLVNMYGITETTVHVTYRPLTARDTAAGSVIGIPIPDLSVRVLDANMEPVPIGVAGEMYIGGAGVARGYLRRPTLTAERFIDDPFRPGARLYKTGDLARWLPGRDLEYLGRIDQQVKIRGFRVELGEIQSVLAAHPGVREAAVIAASDADGGKRLLAYFVPIGEAPSTCALRTHMKTRLPDYMIPAAFIPLATLPLNSNGKLDHHALPAPAEVPVPEPTAEAAPQTELEREIAAFWAEVLGHNGIGLHDDFFAIGGHSLLAIRLLSRMREKFGVDLPVRHLFETPTVSGIAGFILESRGSKAPTPQLHSLVPIQRGDERQRPFFLVPGGWGGEIEFLVYAMLKRHLGSDIPIYGLRARGSDGITAPHESVPEMVADYVAEIRTRQPHGPYLLGGECIGGIIAFEMARLLEAQGEKVALLVLLDTGRPSPDALRRFRAAERRDTRQRLWQARVRQPLRDHCEKLSRLSVGEKLKYIWQRANRSRTWSASTETTRHADDERKLATHYPKLLLGYEIGAYAGKVTLLIPEESHRKFGNQGWDDVATGGLDVHVLPGDHVTYIRDHAAAAAARLREIIDRANLENL